MPDQRPGDRRDGQLSRRDELSLYRNNASVQRGSFPVARAWGEGTLSLPLLPTLQEAEQDYILNVLRYDILPFLDYSAAEKGGVAAL
jgi:hypothetical protein